MKNALVIAAKLCISLLAICMLTSAHEWITGSLEEHGYTIAAVALNIIFSVIVFLLVRWFNKKYNQLSPAQYGFGASRFLARFAVGASVACAIVTLVVLIAVASGIPVVFYTLPTSMVLPLIQLLAVNWFVGVWEECFFRGLVLNTLLKANTRFYIAALITAIVFTGLHAFVYTGNETSSWWFVEIGLLAYVLLYLYVITQSIWTPIAFHFAWDCTWTILDDRENTIGLLRINDYAAHANYLDDVAIATLAITLIVLLIVERKTKATSNFIKMVQVPAN